MKRRNVKQKVSLKPIILTIIIVAALLGIYLLAVVIRKPATSVLRVEELNPQTLEELLAISEDDLDKVDVARMNLLCATGLPNIRKLNVEQYLKIYLLKI